MMAAAGDRRERLAGGGSAAGEAVGWVAVVALVALAALRCVVPFNPDVHWAMDPRGGVMLPEIGSAGTAALDWLGILVLLLAMTASALNGRRVWWGLTGLWAIGLVVAIYHGTHGADSLRIAGNWAGALAMGLAALHLADDRRWRRVMLAGFVALIVPVGLQAMYGVLVEQPATIADYERGREAFLQARGWEEGSAEHRKFEERLYQTQALGRFSLGNVLGTVMATLGLAGAGVLAAMAGGWWKARKEGALPAARSPGPRERVPLVACPPVPWMIGLAALVLLAMVVVYFTFSRGAILAVMVAVGAATVACLFVWRHEGTKAGRHEGAGERTAPLRSRLVVGRGWAVILLAVIVASVGAVVVRGMMGEPATVEGERSLLFRWHYWQAAMSMWGQSPLLGVGPGAFQEQYLLHKNPLNPEDVNDPHNVFVFYLAGLGVGGMAWSLLLLGLVWRVGTGLAGRAAAAGGAGGERGESDWESSAGDGAGGDAAADRGFAGRQRWIAVGAIAVLAFGTQYWIELPRYWAATALLWLVSTAGWVAMAGWLSGRAEWESRLASVGLFAAAAALLAHAQIEMSLTAIMGPPLLLAVLGAAAGGGSHEDMEAPRHEGDNPRGPGPWAIGPIGVVALAAMAVLLLIVAPIGRQQAKLGEAAQLLRDDRLSAAADALAQARASVGLLGGPPNPQIARHEAQLRGELAERADRRRDADARNRQLNMALRALEEGREAGGHARLWRFEATLCRHIYQMTGDRGWLGRAAQAMEHAIEHDPYSITAHVRAGELAWELDDRQQARRWYSRALELHELAYLDPERQLQPEALGRVRQRAGTD